MGRRKAIEHALPAIQRWLTRADVRNYIHCSDDYIDTLVKDGILIAHPASRNAGNKKVWFDRLAIDSWIEGLA